MTASAMSAGATECERGHQPSKPSAKTAKARSGVALTVISRRTAVSVAGMGQSSCVGVSTASLKAVRACSQNASK